MAIQEAMFLSSVLPDIILKAAIEMQFSHDTDALFICNLPVGENLPVSGDYKNKLDFQSEAVLLSIASTVGLPFSFVQESDGRLVQQVVPDPKMAEEQTSTSSDVELLGHTEVTFSNYVGYVALLGLRDNDGEPCGTYICHASDILSELDPNVVNVLKQPLFRMREIDTSFGGGEGPICSIVYGVEHNFAMRFDQDLMTGMTPEAKYALQQFTAVYLEKRYQVFITKGSMLLFDNTKIIHARAPFKVTEYNGMTRWLQRCIVAPTILKNSPYLQPLTSTIKRDNWSGVLM